MQVGSDHAGNMVGRQTGAILCITRKGKREDMDSVLEESNRGLYRSDLAKT